MRKLIVSEFISVDGVVEAPGGEPGYEHSGWVFAFGHPEDQNAYKLQETLDAESLLLGRVTYEGFANAWPERSGEFADKMNSMPKHVVSSTPVEPEWENTTVLEGPVEESVATPASRATAGRFSSPAVARSRRASIGTDSSTSGG